MENVNEKKEQVKQYNVAGYKFATKEAAKTAKDELKAINYLSSRIDKNDIKQVFVLYNSIIEKRLFNTLVGINYLRELQQTLYLSNVIPNEKIQPIPVEHEVNEVIEGKREIIESKGEIRKLRREKNSYKDKFVISLIINFVLIIVIVAMAVITLKSNNPNVVNYEVNIQNKYSSWQSQLESQQASLEERESKLNK